MAEVIAAVQADLGRGRQEELPLSNMQRRDKGPSFMPPSVDASKHYDPGIKQDLNNKWSTGIADEESEQMHGLADLNARPWASSRPQAPTQFKIPKITPPAIPPPAIPPPAIPPPAAPRQAEPSPSTPPSSSPADSTRPLQVQVVYAGKCEVTLHEGRTIVPDAKFQVEVSIDKVAASFMLTAPGKAPVVLNVLAFAVPIVYGTSCIIKPKSGPGTEAIVYKIRPYEPSTADKLARVLENIQLVLCKRMGHTLTPTPPSTPSTPQVVKIAAAKSLAGTYTAIAPPRSLICADSPESSPDQSPRSLRNQLVELPPNKQGDKVAVKLDDVISDIGVDDVISDIGGLVRAAYHQITGCSVPISPSEQRSDVALAEWLERGRLDSDADETKRGLMEILRFLKELQLRTAAAREPPMMSSQTMEVLKTIDRTNRNQGVIVSYSAPEIMELKKAAVVPREMKIKKGLASSLWAKK
ncbi:uncharacterized protein BBA_01056 [Beauveria bassiana ARSEF 2860]|uniref:Uncharacterized protein n=1 Tax=Beauveria bassiana (strain ARSEF 2860) TaxID=655819 RepID=J4UVJ8_BEAB2|nr:uncharacterized protein BBA_01056 [Beauveria bassiana ARSEF 2860]EJP70187.1 hypothetical protein BBA_01056 [Beauveria bassiana ARSEF 2860]